MLQALRGRLRRVVLEVRWRRQTPRFKKRARLQFAQEVSHEPHIFSALVRPRTISEGNQMGGESVGVHY